MAYVINDSCVMCGACESQCPVGAIKAGDGKYEKLGMEYKLKDVKPMEKSRVPELKKHVLNGIKKRRAELEM